MPVRNQNWYDLQAGRRYPLDDRSTGLDDAGNLINDDLIVDCHIKFPIAYGEYAFVSGLTVTANIVTAVICASSDLAGTNITPIAAISIPKPLTTNTNYPVQALVVGVAGWIVFGAGVSQNFSGRYSTPIQSLIAPRNASAYRKMPVQSLRKYELSSKLKNVVNVVAAAPLVADYTTLTIGGSDVNAVLLELRGNTASVPYEPLEYFLGPCGARPESGTCPKQPILSINGVTPDCTGNIHIDFTDGLFAYLFEDRGGIGLDTALSLAAVCQKPPLITGGRDDCDSSGSSISSGNSLSGLGATSSSSAAGPGIPPGSSSSSSHSGLLYALPMCVQLGNILDNLVIRSGTFYKDGYSSPQICGVEDPARYVLRSASVTGSNIAVFDHMPTDWAIDHEISLLMKLTAGIKRNGGILFNYLTPEQTGYGTTYFTAVLNLDSWAFQLLRFNGTNFVNEFTAKLTDYSFGINPDNWYRVSVRTTKLHPEAMMSPIVIECTLNSLGDVVDTISFNVTTDNYGAPIGAAGIFANQAYTYFSQIRILS